jgi:hypothetical protein
LLLVKNIQRKEHIPCTKTRHEPVITPLPLREDT